LGLWGPGNNKSRLTIQSEFDKNAEQYGFEFLDDGNGTEYRNWKNNNWTFEEANKLAKGAKKYVEDYNKTSPWSSGNMLWYGYSKDYIMSTLKKEMSWDKKIIPLSQSLCLLYFKKLEDL
jgi:hypothetical protein